MSASHETAESAEQQCELQNAVVSLKDVDGNTNVDTEMPDLEQGESGSSCHNSGLIVLQQKCLEAVHCFCLHQQGPEPH